MQPRPITLTLKKTLGLSVIYSLPTGRPVGRARAPNLRPSPPSDLRVGRARDTPIIHLNFLFGIPAITNWGPKVLSPDPKIRDSRK